ncbi:hypothetical protein C1646_794940 [Rhizophagus diaphanus]|nr:hypothetical protein C1646_794940 [Rhizophagus diaphanus] [Rhizophagus sp. MUCL 43196]
MNSRQIFFALLIVLMVTIVTASPLTLDQLIKRENTQKDESPSKEKVGKVKATVGPSNTEFVSFWPLSVLEFGGQMIYNWKRQQTHTCLKKLREIYQDTDHT